MITPQAHRLRTGRRYTSPLISATTATTGLWSPLRRRTCRTRDGYTATGSRGAGTRTGFQFPGEGLDVGAADQEQRQGPGTAPVSELQQVWSGQSPRLADLAGSDHGDPDEHRLEGVRQGPGLVDNLPSDQQTARAVSTQDALLAWREYYFERADCPDPCPSGAASSRSALRADRRLDARSPGTCPSLSVTLAIASPEPDLRSSPGCTRWSWRPICGMSGSVP